MDTLETIKFALDSLEKRRQIMKNNYQKNREKRLAQRKDRYATVEKPRKLKCLDLNNPNAKVEVVNV